MAGSSCSGRFDPDRHLMEQPLDTSTALDAVFTVLIGLAYFAGLAFVLGLLWRLLRLPAHAHALAASR